MNNFFTLAQSLKSANQEEANNKKKRRKDGSRSALELLISNLKGRGPYTCTVCVLRNTNTSFFFLLPLLFSFFFSLSASLSPLSFYISSQLHSPWWKWVWSSDCSLFVELQSKVNENLSVNRIHRSIKSYRMQIWRIR